MLKKILVGNLIALLGHILSIALLFATVMLASPLSDESFVIIACIAISLYVLYGFILKPVEKFAFLSVISIAIVLALILLVTSIWIIEYGFLYFFLNPIAFSLAELDFQKPITYLIYLLSPMYPSLLIYLGMVIRKLVRRHRQA